MITCHTHCVVLVLNRCFNITVSTAECNTWDIPVSAASLSFWWAIFQSLWMYVQAHFMGAHPPPPRHHHPLLPVIIIVLAAVTTTTTSIAYCTHSIMSMYGMLIWCVPPSHQIVYRVCTCFIIIITVFNWLPHVL